MLLDAKQLDPKFEQWYKEFMETKFPTVKSIEIDLPENSTYAFTKEHGAITANVPLFSDFKDGDLPTTATAYYKNAPSKKIKLFWGNINSSIEAEQAILPTIEYGSYVPDSSVLQPIVLKFSDMRIAKDYQNYILHKYPYANTPNYRTVKTLSDEVIHELSVDAKTSYVSNALKMFCECFELEELPSVGLDFTKASGAQYLLEKCEKITTIPDEYLNLPSAIDVTEAFYGLTSLEHLDFSKIKLDSAKNVFNLFSRSNWKSYSGELRLPSVVGAAGDSVQICSGGGETSPGFPKVILEKSMKIDAIFSGTQLTYIEGIVAPLAKTSKWAFYNSKVVTIDMLDIPSMQDFTNMFYNAADLKNIPVIDLSNATTVKDMFYGCTSLAEVRFKNVPEEIKPLLTRAELDSSGNATFNIVIE